MRNMFFTRSRMQAFKAGVYLAVPIGLYCFVAYWPTGLDYFVNKVRSAFHYLRACTPHLLSLAADAA
jgi:hypothetical protein